MPKGTATPRTAAKVTYFHLANASDVIPCQQDLINLLGYETTFRVFKDSSGVVSYNLQIQLPGGDQPMIATLNDVLIWDNVQLTKIRIEDFNSKYTVP